MEQRNEVSLLDLWKVIAEQRKAIFLVVTVCVCVGLAYALLAKPVYKAEAFLLPPSQKDIQTLNIGGASGEDGKRIDGISYTPDLVYELLIRELKSRSNRRRFFDENDIANKLSYDAQNSGNLDVFFEKSFNQKMKVNIGRGKVTEFVSLTLESGNAVNAARWLNDYIAFAVQTVSKRLVDDVKFKITVHKEELKDTISGKMALAEKRKLDRILVLEEAAMIAGQLNTDERVANYSGNYGEAEVNPQSIPLYMMGVSALTAQISVLKKRKDDTPFIAGLRDLQEQLAGLEHINIDVSKVNPVFVDSAAIVPESPINPKKA
jgi:chain length determinant protein (polysaccharide antigen chain regulator)